MKKNALPKSLIDALRSVVGEERLLVDAESLFVYSSDALTHFAELPLAVVFPQSTEECSRVVRLATDAEIPITPRGAGTGLSGGSVPPSDGGIVVETSRMQKLIAVEVVDRYAVVEPGLANIELSRAVARHGLFYAPDPSSQTVCTLGGNVAENAGGPHCLRYGATARHVIGLEMVLEDGSVERFGRPGHGSDFDLMSLIVGSEGTLGIVTKLWLRLTPRPQAVATHLAAFASLAAACDAVGTIVRRGIEASAIEALDKRTIAAVEASVFRAGYPLDAEAVLLVELDGAREDVDADGERLVTIFNEHGAISCEQARDEAHRKKLWRGRKGAFGAMGRVAPNIYVMDAVVPRSKLTQAITRIGEICDRHRLQLANVFHAGEGNLHPNISYDGRDRDEVERVLAANAEIVRTCLDLGGTLSGEHGVGLEKKEFMPWLFDEATMNVFHGIKRALAPRGLMNPGKLLPTPRACTEVKGPHAHPAVLGEETT